MAESFVQLAADGTGKRTRTRQRTVNSLAVEEQYVIVQDEAVVSYRGRAGSFIIPGRASATDQRLATIFNASAAVLVRVNRVAIDAYSTAARLVTVPPPALRAQRLTAAPTGGLALVKTPRDTAGTSDANVTLLGDAQSERTPATTALAATVTAGAFLAQEIASRAISGISTASTAMPWFEPADKIQFFAGESDVTLRQTQGLAISAQGAAGSILVSDFFVVTIDWDEYTLP